MAPEAMERDEFTAAADVYSFGEREREGVIGAGGLLFVCVCVCVCVCVLCVCVGMVMWEVATGRAPFEEDKKQLSPVLLVMRLLMGYRPSFSSHHDKVTTTHTH